MEVSISNLFNKIGEFLFQEIKFPEKETDSSNSKHEDLETKLAELLAKGIKEYLELPNKYSQQVDKLTSILEKQSEERRELQSLLKEEIKDQRNQFEQILDLLKTQISKPSEYRNKSQESETSPPLTPRSQEASKTVESTEQEAMGSGEGEQCRQQVDVKSTQGVTDVNLNNAEYSLVEVFNTSQISSTHKVEVSETKASIESRRVGKREPAVFEEVKSAGSGTYLVIIGQEGQLALVPKDKLTINQQRFEAFQASFECRNFQEGKANKLKLVKPAKLSPIVEKQWKLEEKGALEFFQSQSSE
ncbi:MAG: hypothetical protein AB4426_31335 [Xenococcaceae cyanobacterium]